MKIGIILCLLLTSVSSQAFLSVMNTGDILKPNVQRLTVEAQGVASDERGFNFVGYFDSAIDESSEIRAVLGSGVTDFQAGGYYKLIPYPDVDSQPAIGFVAGFIYAREDGLSLLNARFCPLVSKHLKYEIGEFNAYSSLSLGMTTVDGEGLTPIQLVVGTEFKHVDNAEFTWMGEIGLELKDAFTYVSVGLVFPLPE